MFICWCLFTQNHWYCMDQIDYVSCNFDWYSTAITYVYILRMFAGCGLLRGHWYWIDLLARSRPRNWWDQLSRAKNTPVFRDESWWDWQGLLPGYTWTIGDYCAPTSIDELSAKVFEHLWTLLNWTIQMSHDQSAGPGNIFLRSVSRSVLVTQGSNSNALTMWNRKPSFTFPTQGDYIERCRPIGRPTMLRGRDFVSCFACWAHLGPGATAKNVTLEMDNESTFDRWIAW